MNITIESSRHNFYTSSLSTFTVILKIFLFIFVKSKYTSYNIYIYYIPLLQLTKNSNNNFS